ncbi:hypothetical protein GCM10023091_28480 [Ravibacter arvi]|uniref:Signal transduction histidine kinase internal region domain-containing protein n=1 Tax=Ravibacter arvi TaxID=2051041 RepID=A0ABP8M102_9BACT
MKKLKKLKNNLNSFRWLLFPKGPRHRLFVHILFWGCFLSSHLLFFVPAFTEHLASRQAVWAYVAYYLRYIPLYYGLIYFYKKVGVVAGGVALAAGLIIVALLAMHLATIVLYKGYELIIGLEKLPPIFQQIGAQYLKPWNEKRGKDWSVFIYDAIDLQLLILPVGIKLTKYGFAQAVEQLRWREERVRAELKAVRSSLTPHFIFNVLNSAASELGPYPAPSAYIQQAADLIRFTLYEADKDFIQFRKEYYYVQQYVELEAMRTELRSEISFSHFPEGAKAEHSVPTLMLLTLVENAFKHSVHATYLPSFVDIDFQVSGNRLNFKVSNSIPQTPARGVKEDSGMGLNTVKRTLELKFPGDHLFEIRQDDRVFSVRLSLPLNRYRVEH